MQVKRQEFKVKYTKQKDRGFTLLELLVAVSIFSVLVVLVVGSFGFATSYQRRIRVNREVSQAARHVLDTVTREVINSYNMPIRKDKNTNITDNSGETVYNFAILNTRASSSVSDEGAVLVVRDTDDMCRRFYLKRVEGINRLTMDIREKKGCLGSWFRNVYLTDENTDIEELIFSGTHNTKASQTMPYVDIKLKIKNSRKFFGNEITISMYPKTEAGIRNDGRENIFE